MYSKDIKKFNTHFTIDGGHRLEVDGIEITNRRNETLYVNKTEFKNHTRYNVIRSKLL